MSKWLCFCLCTMGLGLHANRALCSAWSGSLLVGPAYPGPDFTTKNNGFQARATGVLVALTAERVVGGGWSVGLDGSVMSLEGPAGQVGESPFFNGQRGTLLEDHFKTYQLGLHTRYSFRLDGRLSPYAIVGVGAYKLREDWVWGLCTAEPFCSMREGFDTTGPELGGKAALGTAVRLSPAAQLLVDAEYDLFHVKDYPGTTSISYLGVRIGLRVSP